jgi:thiopurine S-methyltransferase
VNNLESTYWNKLYQSDETGWDIGYASHPIIKYFEQVNNKGLKILIPGAGNA